MSGSLHLKLLGRIPLGDLDPQLASCFLWFGVQPLEECRDRDDLDPPGVVKA